MTTRPAALAPALTLAFACGLGCPAPTAPVTEAPDAGTVGTVVDVVDAGAAATASPTGVRAKLLPITKGGVGPLRAGAVTRGVVARVFLDGVTGSIEERTETTDGAVVGRAYSVKRGEGVDVTLEAIVHVDTSDQLYSVEILAPIAEVRGVKVGDLLGKALGAEPVKCARGAEERAGAVFCARKAEPTILYATMPPGAGDGPVAPETLRALPITAIVWNPHAN